MFQPSVGLQNPSPLQWLEPRFRILLRCNCTQIISKRKPNFSNPASTCSPKSYASQNSTIVQSAVSGEEGSERLGCKAFVGMETMPRSVAKKGLPGYDMLDP